MQGGVFLFQRIKGLPHPRLGQQRIAKRRVMRHGLETSFSHVARPLKRVIC
jgi:hypothetical protein